MDKVKYRLQFHVGRLVDNSQQAEVLKTVHEFYIEVIAWHRYPLFLTIPNI